MSHDHQNKSHNKYLGMFVDLEKALLAKTCDRRTVLSIIADIQVWTNGQPFLTQLICYSIANYAGPMDDQLATGIVAKVVQQKIVQDWENNAAATHLKKVRDNVWAHRGRKTLFTLYGQILQKGAIAFNQQSLEQEVLLRLGLARKAGKQIVADPIYSQVFGLEWVEQLLSRKTTQPSLAAANSSTPAALTMTAMTAVPEPSRGSLSFWLNLCLRSGIVIGAIIVAGLYFQQHPFFRRVASQTPMLFTSHPSLNPLERKSHVEGLTQLTLLGDTFSGYSTFRNADFNTALEKTGIKLKYRDEFDQSLRAEKLSKGQADLLVTTLDQFLLQQPKGKIIGLLDRTIGADAVVLNTRVYPSLRSLQNLNELVMQARIKGEILSIAYAADTPSEYLALVLDTKFDGFELSDFQLQAVADASEAWHLMQDPDQNVAIAVLWEPYVTQARQKGYNIVLSSNDAPNAILDVIVASDSLIESDPTVLSHLLEGYYRRIDANTGDATQLQTQVAEDGSLFVSEAAAVISGIDFFNAIESKAWIDNGTLATRIGATSAVLNFSNRLDEPITDVQSLYTGQFLLEAVQNSQTLINLIRADNPTLADKLAGNSNDTVTPVSQLSAEQIKESPDIGALQVRGKVSFAKGSAELTDAGKQTLDALANELKEFNSQTVAARVIGHTSRTGSADMNQHLSEERNRVVVTYLKAKSVTMNISGEGRGFSDPLPGIDPADARNQRTEIRLVRVE